MRGCRAFFGDCRSSPGWRSPARPRRRTCCASPARTPGRRPWIPMPMRRRQQGGDLPGLRGAARRRFQPGDRAAARPRLEDRRPDALGVRAAPGRAFPRRHAVHRRGCGVQHRARAGEDVGFPGRVDGIAAVEAIDDHTIRITTTAPDPSLWLKLADVAIMSKAWAQAHDVTTPADFVGAREETYASRHANGTGPFVLEVVRAARRLGHGPQSRLVGHGGVSAQHRSRRSRRRKPIPRTSPPCSMARSICSRPCPTGRFPDPQQPGAEARLPDQAAHDVLRPRPGQRRAALIQHQRAQPVQGQAGAPGDGPRDRHAVGACTS